MNMSRLISHLKMSLGLYSITLPFKDEVTGQPIPTENIIRDVITISTIPIFSQFQPWLRESIHNLSGLKVIDAKNSIYQLPFDITTTPVMYVADVSIPVQNNRGSFGTISPAFGINHSVQGVITSQASMMLAGQIRAEPTFEYKGENKIRLYGYPKMVLNFKVACEHLPNGESIPDGCYESFSQLADLDLKIFLYNNLKLYDGIATAFGNIQLKIDDYQSATGERAALLERWEDIFHLDMGWETFM